MMENITPSTLTAWQNFYVVLGSAAGALTGLQFVVITLVMQARSAGNLRDINAFGTPTVIHFCTALLISAGMCAPWQEPAALGTAMAVSGAAGLAYSLRVIVHACHADYRPDFEDLVWYIMLPVVAHLALLAAAVAMYLGAGWSLKAVAADAAAFLVLGIHNSWDTVTYIAVQHSKKSGEPTRTEEVSDK